MYGYMGLRSIGSDQLDRFRTQRYNHKKKDFAFSRSVPFGSDKNILKNSVHNVKNILKKSVHLVKRSEVDKRVLPCH